MNEIYDDELSIAVAAAMQRHTLMFGQDDVWAESIDRLAFCLRKTQTPRWMRHDV